jgi:hypothetical protein
MLVDRYRKDVSWLSSDNYKFPNQYFKNRPKSSEHVGVNEQPFPPAGRDFGSQSFDGNKTALDWLKN